MSLSTPMRRVATLGAVGVAALAAAPAAHASAKIASGSTALTLDKGTAAVLADNGVSVTPVSPAKANGRTVTFPVSGGAIDFSNAQGQINHRGGLVFKAHGKKVKVTNFQIKVGKGSVAQLTAKAGTARIPLVHISLKKAKVSRSGFGTTVANTNVVLAGPAAKALNKAFGVKLFKRGIVLGKATVKVQPAELELAGAETKLALSKGAADALTSLGVSAAPIDPATAGSDGLAFPITQGKVNAKTLAGQIKHSGGIRLSKGSTVVDLKNFTITIDGDPDLTAEVGGSRVSILTLDLAGLTKAVDGRTVTLGGVKAKLTKAAADALNSAFGVTAFSEGLELGTATVVAEAK